MADINTAIKALNKTGFLDINIDSSINLFTNILKPSKKVLLPDLKAGCSLSDSAPPVLKH